MDGPSALVNDLQSTVASLTKSVSSLTRERDTLLMAQSKRLKSTKHLVDVISSWRNELEDFYGKGEREKVGMTEPGVVNWSDSMCR